MNVGRRKYIRHAALVACALGVGSQAMAQTRIASLEERFAGAERVVVAETRSVSARWRETERGDRIIVSRVTLDVVETLKGAEASELWMDVEGGTIDGLTLEVSSLPLMHEGERAVFFLDAAERSVHRPFLKGQGILSLDDREMVRGSSLHLNQIRRLSRGGR